MKEEDYFDFYKEVLDEFNSKNKTDIITIIVILIPLLFSLLFFSNSSSGMIKLIVI